MLAAPSGPHCQRSRSTSARLQGLWDRIPPGAWMFFCCECCVLLGRGLCYELITRPDESYRVWYVVVCDLETSWVRSLNQSIVIKLKNRRCITECISYMPLIVTVKHDCWMSLDRLRCSRESYKKSYMLLTAKYLLFRRGVVPGSPHEAFLTLRDTVEENSTILGKGP
jgi:hypothetical protein